jgi:hypothetical protein
LKGRLIYPLVGYRVAPSAAVTAEGATRTSLRIVEKTAPPTLRLMKHGPPL